MATLHDPGTTQPIIDPSAAAIDGDLLPGDASASCLLTAEDWAAIDEGERDADAGRFVSDEEMTKLVPGW